MNYLLQNITLGNIFTALSFIIAATVFVAGIRPRFTAIDEKFKTTLRESNEKFSSLHSEIMVIVERQNKHEDQTRERDKEFDKQARDNDRERELIGRERDSALHEMALGLATMTSTISEIGRRVAIVEGEVNK